MKNDRNHSHDLTRSRAKARRYMAAWTALVLALALTTLPAFAASGGSDPLSIVNNLSDFIFSCIKAIGVIILGWGIVQLGMSIQSHDPSQRSNGMLTIAGGIVIAFTREILTLITGA